MGLWDEALKAGKLFSDFAGDSQFNFRCPNCGSVASALKWSEFPSKHRAAEWYRDRKFNVCSNCSWKYGIDPDRAYIRCPDGDCTQAHEGIVGVYWTCGRPFVITKHDDRDIYFRCPCTYRMCTSVSQVSQSHLIGHPTSGRKIRVHCQSDSSLELLISVDDVMRLQLPNYVDRLETAVLPQSAVHALEREMVRLHKGRLATLGYQNAHEVQGRRVAYRRLTIRSNEVIDEELVYEEIRAKQF